jgi:hypothetical protein
VKFHALVPLVVLVAPQEAGFAPSEADWAARDLEGRWVLVERETLEHGWARVDSLVRFLEQRREAELLERLCLYPRSEGHFATFEAALARLDAPQWARAVEWNLRQNDSHKRDEANSAFFERRPRVARAWLEAHERELRPLATDVLARLRASSVASEPTPHLLAPWKLEELLSPLAAAQEVLDFGSKTHAEPGALYLHQVEDALRAVAQKQLFEEPWLSQVLALTRHDRAESRAHAWLTLGEAARGRIPAERLDTAAHLAVIDSGDSDARVRTAATLALGRRADWDALAWCELHRIALDPRHAAWASAVHSLRQCGDAWSAELLAELARKLEEPTQRHLAEATVDALRASVAPRVYLTLERTAIAELVRSPITKQRSEWTARKFDTSTDKDEAQALADVAANYASPADLKALVERAAPGSDLDATVRGLASRLGRNR